MLEGLKNLGKQREFGTMVLEEHWLTEWAGPFPECDGVWPAVPVCIPPAGWVWRCSEDTGPPLFSRV